MSVKQDGAGRRFVQAEVEVIGTPEEVWQAIATGPGVSSWFVPTDVETDDAGAPVRIISHFGPGMDSVAVPVAWDPPHRLAAESRDLGPDAPPVATEWLVEARAGGVCVVRVVHSLFTSSDEWDDQLEEIEAGWPDFFRILRLYLEHFRGQPCTMLPLMGVASESAPQAWSALTDALGLASATTGERRSAPSDAPPLAGLVVPSGDGAQLLLRLDAPIPGIAHLFALATGGMVIVSLRLFLYGDQAAAVVARDEAAWHSWMSQRFPSPDSPAA